MSKEEMQSATERKRALRSTLIAQRARLSPEERALLVLRLDRDLAWREVATVLSADGEPVDEAALRKRFERLKAKLAQLAREEGLLE
jgi:RNA polymerase sigma-70 factor (ECF subfamily)